MDTIEKTQPVQLLTDWEYETWTRVYYKVLRNGNFAYSYYEKEA